MANAYCNSVEKEIKKKILFYALMVHAYYEMQYKRMQLICENFPKFLKNVMAGNL